MANNAAHTLLNFIIHNRLATMEEKQSEFASRAIDPGEQVAEMTSHNVQTEEEAAGRLVPGCGGGLRAAGAQRAQGGALVLDDADPQQNAMADALIRFLVKPLLATVDTEEVAAGHFRYHVTPDWAGLERTATLAGVDLNAALA
jgi:hypothetical protein